MGSDASVEFDCWLFIDALLLCSAERRYKALERRYILLVEEHAYAMKAKEQLLDSLVVLKQDNWLRDLAKYCSNESERVVDCCVYILGLLACIMFPMHIDSLSIVTLHWCCCTYPPLSAEVGWISEACVLFLSRCGPVASAA